MCDHCTTAACSNSIQPQGCGGTAVRRPASGPRQDQAALPLDAKTYPADLGLDKFTTSNGGAGEMQSWEAPGGEHRLGQRFAHRGPDDGRLAHGLVRAAQGRAPPLRADDGDGRGRGRIDGLPAAGGRGLRDDARGRELPRARLARSFYEQGQ